MFDEFTAWWLRQMRSLRPRSAAGGMRDATIIAVEALGDDHSLSDRGSVLARRDGQERLVAPLDLQQQTAVPPAPATGLRLPAGMVLHREVALPLAAERDLGQVLGFEMDRLTPFDAGEVFWGVSGVARDPARGLRLTLIVAPRRPVQALLDRLARVGLRPSFLDSEAGRIELVRDRAVAGAPRLLQVLCAALALLCLVLPLLRQQIALDQTADRLAAMDPFRLEVAALRQRLTVAAAGQAAVAAARGRGDTLQILAALTTALPDDTSLNDLTLRDGDLSVDGQSANVPALIGRLAGTPLFHDPRFIAPVTRAPGGGSLFSIQIKVAP